MAVTNEEEFKEWLEAQEFGTRVAIAYRSVMRVLPFVMGTVEDGQLDRRVFVVLRAVLALSVTSVQSPFEATNNTESFDAFPRVNSFYADHTSTKEERAFAAVRHAAYAGAKASVAAENAAAATALSFPSAAYADTRRDPRHLGSFPIEVSLEVSEVIDGLRADEKSVLGGAGPWAFWARWYERAIAGDPLPWKLLERIARLPDEVWASGADVVAAEIARLEAEFELRERIAEFEAGWVGGEQTRFGIGGNSPPEEIDDPEVAAQVTIVWESIAGLKEEVEAKEPDPESVSRWIEKLDSALRAILAWCGRKADLAVDTTIKYIIPAGATGYFVLVPSRAEAVLKAAQAWLPFLLP